MGREGCEGRRERMWGGRDVEGGGGKCREGEDVGREGCGGRRGRMWKGGMQRGRWIEKNI